MFLTIAMYEYGKKGIVKLAQKVNGNNILTFMENESQLAYIHITKELKTHIYQNIWKCMHAGKNIKKNLNIH